MAPTLTAGAYDVILRHTAFGEGRKLRRVLARLHIPMPPFGWRARLAIQGKNRLVAGAMQQTAEAIAAVCAQEGLPATVAPAKPRWRATEWLARHRRILAAIPAAYIPLRLLTYPMPDGRMLPAILSHTGAKFSQDMLELVTVLPISFAVVYLPIATLLMFGTAAPIRDLPERDPGAAAAGSIAIA